MIILLVAVVKIVNLPKKSFKNKKVNAELLRFMRVSVREPFRAHPQPVFVHHCVFVFIILEAQHGCVQQVFAACPCAA